MSDKQCTAVIMVNLDVTAERSHVRMMNRLTLGTIAARLPTAIQTPDAIEASSMLVG